MTLAKPSIAGVEAKPDQGDDPATMPATIAPRALRVPCNRGSPRRASGRATRAPPGGPVAEQFGAHGHHGASLDATSAARRSVLHHHFDSSSSFFSGGRSGGADRPADRQGGRRRAHPVESLRVAVAGRGFAWHSTRRSSASSSSMRRRLSAGRAARAPARACTLGGAAPQSRADRRDRDDWPTGDVDLFATCCCIPQRRRA